MKGRINSFRQQRALLAVSDAFRNCANDLEYGRLKQRLNLLEFHYKDELLGNLLKGRIENKWGRKL